jgi:hypothetical protein
VQEREKNEKGKKKKKEKEKETYNIHRIAFVCALA